MNSSRDWSMKRTAVIAAWIAVKVALFILLGRTETARFVYAGF
jgi:hypothetical protein